MDEILEELQVLADHMSIGYGDKLLVSRRDNDDGKGEFVLHDYRLEESFFYELDEVRMHLETIFKGDEHEIE